MAKVKDWDFSGLEALYINCMLKKSSEIGNIGGLVTGSRFDFENPEHL